MLHLINKLLTEKRLQEKEKLLENLQSQYHGLGECVPRPPRSILQSCP